MKRERPLILEPGASLLTDDALRASYAPSAIELEEYAKWMGLPLNGDSLALAEEGLKAALPEGWKKCRSAEGEDFYFHTATGESTWEHPVDKMIRKKIEDKKTEKNWKEELEGLRSDLDERNKEIARLKRIVEDLVEALRESQNENLFLCGKKDVSRDVSRDISEIKLLLKEALKIPK